MRLIPILFATAGALAAQAHFSPAAAVGGTGNVNNTLPFAQTSYQYQQVHSATSFDVMPSGLVTRMRFRPKALTTAGTADLELFMSRSPNSAATASSTYANNEIAASIVNVVVRKMVNMPSVAANVWGGPDFVFDVPFIAVPNQHLSWRTIIYSNTATPYTLDCYSDWRFGRITAYPGCAHPLGTRTAAHNSTFRSPGQPWDLNGYSYVPNTTFAGALLIGESNSFWGTIPLPFDFSGMGANGCQLVNNPAIILPGTTISNVTGFLGMSVPSPADMTLIGATLYTQYLFLDPGANPLGLFTSNGHVNGPIPAPIEVARIYGGITGLSGTIGPEFALPIGLN